MQDIDTSEDEEKHIIVSEKDKRFLKMKEIIDKINKKMNIKDFSSLLEHFEELNKELEKSKKILEKEGIPRFYIRTIALIESTVANFSAEDKKKLNSNNNKAFNTLK